MNAAAECEKQWKNYKWLDGIKLQAGGQVNFDQWRID